MNPCQCGNRGHLYNDCKCTIEQIRRYTAKLSEPLLDRIDIHVTLPSLKVNELSSLPSGETSRVVRARVIAARKVQIKRQGKLNYALHHQEIVEYCVMEKKAKDLLLHLTNKLGLSARAYCKLQRVARTIADIANKDVIAVEHVAQSAQYRQHV